jgi:NAD(P)-dependent dehydrogenase (short-subunit alcohol dehydrogenase family)
MNGDALGDKVVVVTCAATPVGRAVVETLVRRGARVIAAVHSAAAEASVADVLDAGVAQTVECDMTSSSSVAEMTQEVARTHGRIDALICGAMGPLADRPEFHSSQPADWRLAFDQNLRAMFLCARSLLPIAIAQQGASIVLSTTTLDPQPGDDVAIEASLAGVVALSRTIALQYATQGVRCNAVASPAWGTVAPGTVTPREIAPTYGFLASDESSYVTGSVYTVDGARRSVDDLDVAVGA